MIALLDVSVLIALIDPAHIGHLTAHAWFAREHKAGWATCPLTQNGALRILSHPKYPNSPGGPPQVLPALHSLLAQPGHAFWPDEISLLDDPLIAQDRLLTSGQLTDTYLLALAVFKGGRLATFDRRLAPDAVKGGRDALHLITDAP